MDYTIENAKWTNYGLDNNIFYLSYGDFRDEDGDTFFFLIEYRKEEDKYVFFMVFDYDELIYGCGNLQVDTFFEKYMSKELMETTKEYMKNLMK